MKSNELDNIEQRAQEAANSLFPVCAADFAWLVTEVKRLRLLLEGRVEELVTSVRQHDQLLTNQKRLVDLMHVLCRHLGLAEDALTGDKPL